MDLSVLPTRAFIVTVPAEDTLRETETSLTIIGHAAKVLDSGALEISRYAGPALWSVALLAAGSWFRVTVNVPTDEDLDAFERVQAEQKRVAELTQALRESPVAGSRFRQ